MGGILLHTSRKKLGTRKVYNHFIALLAAEKIPPFPNHRLYLRAFNRSFIYLFLSIINYSYIKLVERTVTKNQENVFALWPVQKWPSIFTLQPRNIIHLYIAPRSIIQVHQLQQEWKYPEAKYKCHKYDRVPWNETNELTFE